ncbi:sirohydrochlorin chelatase [Aeromicrobium sp. CTD01-1L150]|uniref:sirohydrochlorin chelatase n=1 Tax=Aeromicrobium sp. CTD01-1L150 TaxID=3341830 RepID=UPI0035BFFC46
MRPALVATSHGTSDPAGQAAIAALVDAVREQLPGVDVHEAFVDVQSPRPDEVTATLGGRVTVVPLLLAPGFHARVDIARAARAPESSAAATLGPDRRLVAVLVRRLLESGVRDGDTLVLGAAGSHDPAALACFEQIARDLGAAVGQIVPIGYVGGNGRPLEDVVREARQADRRVVVSSLLMAPGFFHGRLAVSGADVVTRPLLDGDPPDPRLVELVIDRHDAALTRFASARSGG